MPKARYTLEELQATSKDREFTRQEKAAWNFMHLTKEQRLERNARQRELSKTDRARDKSRKKSARWRTKNPEKALEATRKSAMKHRDKRNAQTAAWRAANPEHVKAYQAEYDARDPEARLAKRREREAVNPEPNRKRRRDWNKANPEYQLAQKHKRRALKLRAGGSFTRLEIDTLLLEQGSRCANPYCHADLRVTKKHLDHVVALTLGGTNGIENLQWLCAPCNQRKTNFEVGAWLMREAARCQHLTPTL